MMTSIQYLHFPLNVYAALLLQGCDSLQGLGYGSLSETRSGYSSADAAACLQQAQRDLRQTLVQYMLAAPPARVLDLGCGDGALACDLSEAGYEVVAVDYNAAAIDLARQHIARRGCSVQLYQRDMAETGDLGMFDVVVLQNSARYVTALQMFVAAREALRPGGQLLVLEEFVSAHGADDTRREVSELAALPHVLTLAERCHLHLDLQLDLSAGIQHFIAVLLQQLVSHWEDMTIRAALVSRAGVSETALAELIRALRLDAEKNTSGYYCHQLLSWTWRPPADDVQLLPAGQLPADAFREVFEASFGNAFDAALWHWKYGEGRGASVAALKQGRVVAHYGGTARDIVYFGQPDRAVQVGDVMVLPGERSFFSRRGLFFQTAATMLEMHAGYHGRHLLGFGFPNLKAMHVAERLGLYKPTDELLQLSVMQPLSNNEWHLMPVTDASTFAALAEQLWPVMKGALHQAIVGVRDAPYMIYRYVQRPAANYRWYQVSDGQQSKALIVLKEEANYLLLMDVIADPDNLPALLLHVSAALSPEGKPLKYWLTAGQVDRWLAPALDEQALLRESLNIQIPCNVWSRGPDPGTLSHVWWLTAGDMDFV